MAQKSPLGRPDGFRFFKLKIHRHFWTLDILLSTLDILLSTLDILPSTLDISPSTFDILSSTLDKNLHSPNHNTRKKKKKKKKKNGMKQRDAGNACECYCYLIQWNPLYGHPLNTDTRILRTVSFAPTKSSYIFSKINPLINTDTS